MSDGYLNSLLGRLEYSDCQIERCKGRLRALQTYRANTLCKIRKEEVRDDDVI